MSELDLYQFPRSLEVLASLRRVLSCGLCQVALDQDPVTSGQCGHSFCRPCLAKEAGQTCPLASCKIPRWPGDLRSDRTIEQVTQCVLALQQLLSPKINDSSNSSIGQISKNEKIPGISGVAEGYNKSAKKLPTEIVDKKKNKNRTSDESTKKVIDETKSKDAQVDETLKATIILHKKSESKEDKEKVSKSTPPSSLKVPKKRTSLPDPGLIRSTKNTKKRSRGATCEGVASSVLLNTEVASNAPLGTPSVPKVTNKRGRVTTCEGMAGSVLLSSELTSKVPLGTPSVPKVKNLEKKNKKGETPLHSAAAKGNLSLVQDLLGQGASPNTWDHAGWTPLHEAASAGRVELVSTLLAAGAAPSVYSTEERETPLHDAAASGQVEVVRILVSHGADKGARNSRGLTPGDVATDPAVVDIMNQTKVEVRVPEMEVVPLAPEEFVICCGAGLGTKESLVRKLGEAASKLGCGRVLKQPRAGLTHMLVEAGEELGTSTEYYSALLTGAELVDCQWLLLSQEAGHLLECNPFRCVRPEDEEGAVRARQTRIRRSPGLLAGCHFFLSGQTYPPYPSKGDIQRLLQEAGGKVLSRQPDPENIPMQERTMAHHGREGGLEPGCSHILLYQEGRQEPQIKYNMPHVKTLSVKWLFKCFNQFKLLSPSTFQ